MKTVALIIIMLVSAFFSLGAFGMAYAESRRRKMFGYNPDDSSDE